MKPKDMTREQLEEVANQAWALCPDKGGEHDPYRFLRAALNPSPLPTRKGLTEIASRGADTWTATTGYCRIYAHALRLAARRVERDACVPGWRALGMDFRAWADEMEAR